jgi:hypothetical protein
VPFFAFRDAERFYGEPEPEVGARVRFVPDKLLDYRYGPERTADQKLESDAGLMVQDVATIVLSWPTSLWRVDDLERPMRGGYRRTRCLAFTVVEQVPTWLVAGPHGDAVEWVISLTRKLTGDQVHALASMPNEGEAPLKQAMWEKWQHTGSPVGCGLLTLSQAVDDAARRVGSHLFALDEDGVESLNDPSWLRAFGAAHSAALGLGAPELFAPHERAVLVRRWSAVFGTPSLSG